MSSFDALALLGALTVSGAYVIVVILGKTLSITSIVQAGLVDGVPVSVEYRRRLIWYVYFGVMNTGTILMAIATLVEMQIGMSVDDPKLQNLMYFGASMAALLALGWAFGTASTMRYHLTLLRKEEERGSHV